MLFLNVKFLFKILIIIGIKYCFNPRRYFFILKIVLHISTNKQNVNNNDYELSPFFLILTSFDKCIYHNKQKNYSHSFRHALPQSSLLIPIIMWIKYVLKEKGRKYPTLTSIIICFVSLCVCVYTLGTKWKW